MISSIRNKKKIVFMVNIRCESYGRLFMIRVILVINVIVIDWRVVIRSGKVSLKVFFVRIVLFSCV